MLVGLLAAVYVVVLKRFRWYASGIDVAGMIVQIGFVVWCVLEVLVSTTRFTKEGVEHRTWYGRKRMNAYNEVSVLEDEGKSVLIYLARGKSLKITKREANLSALGEILKHRVRFYGFDS